MIGSAVAAPDKRTAVRIAAILNMGHCKTYLCG
jgi:hypothetical protein